MEKFSDMLETLESADNIQCIELYDASGALAGKLANKPGTKGSIKIYQHLFNTFGSMTQDAAVEGLALFGEYTEDAENNPGKHPNIDRLFDVLESDTPLTMKIIREQAESHS